MRGTKGKTAGGRRARRGEPERKAYIGLWTSRESKDALQELAHKSHRSVSAYIDSIIEEHLAYVAAEYRLTDRRWRAR